MSSKVFQSADYNNDDYTGLIDRIINIKFTRKSGKTITLRSDYEPLWINNRLYFKTCQPKPEIRVQYTQYQATMINVDIYITNFNIIENVDAQTDQSLIDAGISAISNETRHGNTTNQPNDALTRLGDHIVKAEIELGYRGNFYNWAQEQSPAKNIKEAYAAFMNLEVPGEAAGDFKRLADTQSFFKAHRRCHVVIEWATNISNPPDRITQFHGYVGSTSAGFQPFALLSLDCSAESGATGQITKNSIYKGLDDEYHTTDQVANAEIKKEKNGTPFDILIDYKPNVFRNYFNGGKGFTLLEGYCFHMVSRRFVRSDIDVTRNKKLEQAALEYAEKTNYVGNATALSSVREEIEQKVYRRERQYYRDYFSKPDEASTEKETIKLLDKAPETFKKYLKEGIDSLLIEYYIGVRLTIKNLPEYRKLYLAIRRTLNEAAKKGEYMAWWDAAEKLKGNNLDVAAEFNTATQTNKTREDKKVGYEAVEGQSEDTRDANEKQALREYVFKLDKGEYAYKDCYITDESDYILPVQNIVGSVDLLSAKGDRILFKAPKLTETGFVPNTKADEQPVKCFTGLFEVRDAYIFGVPVLCSEGASRIFNLRNKEQNMIEVQFFQDPQAQVEWICRTWGFQYYKLHNGGFYIYAANETVRDTTGQDFVTNQSETPFKIPAIYDMTISPMRTIRMPFVAFLNPMTIIEWNSSAMIGSMISYYYQPNKGRNFFMVIKNSIDFATISDFNTMELQVVDTQYVDKSEVPASVLTQKEVKIFTDVLIFPDDQLNTWKKIYESPVGKIPFDLRHLWTLNTVVSDKNISIDGRVSPYQFFMLMKEWNPQLFALSTEGETGWSCLDSFKKVDKQANKLYGGSRPDEKVNFPDIENCLSELIPSSRNRIFMKFPLMPDKALYDEEIMKKYDDKYILVYQYGVWEMKPKEAYKKYIDSNDSER